MPEVRLIDANALMEKVCGNCQENYCVPDATDTVYGCELADIIDQMPTIEAEPVRRWIPCSERLPEMPIEEPDAMYSDCCLVCDSHEWIGMAYCLTDGKKTWWEFADAQNKVKIDWTEVTHWMTLPEPPEVNAYERGEPQCRH